MSNYTVNSSSRSQQIFPFITTECRCFIQMNKFFVLGQVPDVAVHYSNSFIITNPWIPVSTTWDGAWLDPKFFILRPFPWLLLLVEKYPDRSPINSHKLWWRLLSHYSLTTGPDPSKQYTMISIGLYSPLFITCDPLFVTIKMSAEFIQLLRSLSNQYFGITATLLSDSQLTEVRDGKTQP
jgi:hypothetical protein